jgi:sigma-B regulation protein RsbU (phosphoserine phosphatase)
MDTDIDKHVTMFVGIIDAKSRILTYSVGAHFPMPILTSGGQSVYLEGKGMPIGIFKEPEFNLYEKVLPEGFRLTVFSDGILEVVEAETLTDKENKLLEVVSKEWHSVESLCDAMGVSELKELPDDIAVLTVSDGKSWTD